MFITCSISSALIFICVCWGGNISKQDRDRLDDIIKKAKSGIGKRENKFDTNYQRRLKNKLIDVLYDDTYPLKTDFVNTIIQISGHFRVPMFRTNIYAGSFVSSLINVRNMTIGSGRSIYDIY